MKKRFSKHILFLSTSSCYLLGIGIHNITNNILTTTQILLAFAGVFFVYALQIKLLRVYLLVGVIGAAFGVLISQNSYLNSLEKQQIISDYQVSSKTELVVTEVYKIEEFSKSYLVTLDSHNISGIIKVPFNFSLQSGDIISISENIKLIKNFNSDFNYQKYMFSKNIYFKSNLSSYKKIGYKQPNSIIGNIQKIRTSLLTNIKEIYPKEEAIFLGGILIGARENLPNRLKTNFNNSGLTHFIAVSGFNITILIIFIGYIGKFLPVIFRTILIISSIILFTLLVGDTAPVIRSSIMGIIGYMALISGRKGQPFSILLLTGIIMVSYSPLSINYDVSLHLSFLAVLGIIYTQGFFSHIFSRITNRFEIREALVLTFAAFVFTLPIMVINFGQLSIISPVTNVLVAWTIPIAMLLGFMSIIVYFFIPIVGEIVGYFTWILLKWDIMVVHFFGELRYSVLQINLGEYKYIIMLSYFLIVSFVIFYTKLDNKKDK